MRMSMHAAMLVDAISDSMTEKTALDGIGALVHRHYDKYSDATELDHIFLTRLLYVAEDADLTEDDVYEVVREAESDINDAGGIQGSDGNWHSVRTPQAYEDIDEE